ncbi:hypothetical protein L3X38_019462 [Prunus dulcis]|uniref:Uncharacterized protein n=1 Tax=Prunus dulcis TaxID=3755 RepID=A0AAD4WB24_PRUDU|nr:hypothetical protein L3X38_019462 [Prunus dulcis]
MGDDPKHYTESFRTPEHPAPHMESVSHAETSNVASETDNLFFPHAGTSNAACGKSNNWISDLAAVDGWRWTGERRRGLVGRFGSGLEAGRGL